MRYFEDFVPGQSLDLGSATFTEEEIVAFSREWDPQPMHVDTGTEERMYDGLIASGWHTVCAWMRCLCDAMLLDARSMGAPGVEHLRWKRPVRPGDRLAMSGTVVSARPSASRPAIGLVKFRFEAVNQDGETAMTALMTIMFERREGAPAAP